MAGRQISAISEGEVGFAVPTSGAQIMSQIWASMDRYLQKTISFLLLSAEFLHRRCRKRLFLLVPFVYIL